MLTLHTLKNTSKKRKKPIRVGRGIGSGKGKTCGRGQKGAGARSGYKRRHGYEGGQFPLFQKLPCRGFSNARFRKTFDTINLRQIEQIFEDGDVVNEQSLKDHGFISGKSNGVKILGSGDLTKKVSIEAVAFSKGAKEKLDQAKIAYTIVTKQKGE